MVSPNQKARLRVGITSFTERMSLTILLALLALPAFAAGGSCPSGANYLNAQTDTQNVTLASLGITSCFYVAANGSDANSGTSESSPWQHAPMMPGCSGNCAAVNVSQGTQLAGSGFIFRGGDTWHFGNSSATPYTGGVWEWNPSSGGPSGTPSNPIYLGVDQTWYTGASWARPILTGDNPLSTSAVSSCTYQIPNGSFSSGQAVNNILDFGNDEYFIVDNFEMLGVCEQDLTTNSAPANGNTYVRHPATSNMTLQNLYLHGSTHVPFSCSNNTGHCENLIYLGGGCCSGVGTNTSIGTTIAYTVADNCDSDPTGAGIIQFEDMYNVYKSVFRCSAQGLYGNMHTVHDNLLEIWSQPGDNDSHGNFLESNGEFNGTNAFYNNLIRDLCEGGTPAASCPGGIAGWLPQPVVGQTNYAFNNVVYNVIATEGPWDMGGPVNVGEVVYFNNTLQSVNTLFSCYSTNPPTAPWTSTNEHLVSDAANAYTPNCTLHEAASPLTDLLMTNSTATTDGYTSSQTSPYSPSSSSSPTVAVGTNLQSVCTTLSGSSDPLIQAAGTACKNDTTNGPFYDTTTHTVTGVVRTTLTRPSTGAWDIGAYQFNTQDPPPSAPSGLTAVVN